MVSMHLFHMGIPHCWWLLFKHSKYITWFSNGDFWPTNRYNSNWALILAAMLPEQFDHFLRRLIGMRTPKVSWPNACITGDCMKHMQETQRSESQLLKCLGGSHSDHLGLVLGRPSGRRGPLRGSGVLQWRGEDCVFSKGIWLYKCCFGHILWGTICTTNWKAESHGHE